MGSESNPEIQRRVPGLFLAHGPTLSLGYGVRGRALAGGTSVTSGRITQRQREEPKVASHWA